MKTMNAKALNLVFFLQYGVGFPEVLMGDNIDMAKFDSYFGVALVKIVPPRGLKHPVLPQRLNNRLIFCLCAKCGDGMSQQECKCTDEQRSWIGKLHYITQFVPNVWGGV